MKSKSKQKFCRFVMTKSISRYKERGNSPLIKHKNQRRFFNVSPNKDVRVPLDGDDNLYDFERKYFASSNHKKSVPCISKIQLHTVKANSSKQTTDPSEKSSTPKKISETYYKYNLPTPSKITHRTCLSSLSNSNSIISVESNSFSLAASGQTFVDNSQQLLQSQECEKKTPNIVMTKSNKDEDVIILSDEDTLQCFTSRDIKRCVKNIVDNAMTDKASFIENLCAVDIAQRMQTLHHQDFTNRLKEIGRYLDEAKRMCSHHFSQTREVRPGIRKLDLDTLEPGQWLNDVIVNKYISLLVSSKPWACCVSSFFYEILQRHQKHSLPEDWFEKKYFLIPICIGHHWSLLCALPDEQCVEIYNSMCSSESEFDCALKIKDYLETNYNQEQKTVTEWTVIIPEGVARQTNEYDCGVYVCMFARKILYDLSSEFDSSQVQAFRSWLRKELLKNRIEN